MWLLFVLCFAYWLARVLFLAALVGLNRAGKVALPRPKAFLIMCLCSLVSVSFSGCNGPTVAKAGPSQLSTVQQVQAIEKPAQAVQEHLNKALALAEQIQAGKVTVEIGLPQLHEELVQAKAPADEIVKALPAAEKTATTEAKASTKKDEQIAELKKSDPIKTWGLVIGGLSVAGGIALLVLSVFFPVMFGFPQARSIGAAAAVFGAIILTLVWYLNAIRLTLIWSLAILALAAVVSGLIWLWAHRKTLAEDAKWLPITLPVSKVTP